MLEDADGLRIEGHHSAAAARATRSARSRWHVSAQASTAASAAEIAGRATAEAIHLAIEYGPAPPFGSGSPETADPAVLAAVLAWAETCQRDRAERVARAAAAL